MTDNNCRMGVWRETGSERVGSEGLRDCVWVDGCVGGWVRVWMPGKEKDRVRYVIRTLVN